MREIKFRGKVADEPNEWVYGYLTDENTIYQPKETKYSKNCGIGVFTVIPETIGQYTGLKDKNGVDIYEGDIVKYPSENVKYEVMFDPSGYWCLDGNGARNSEMLIQTDDTNKYIEAIGNIYENEVKND